MWKNIQLITIKNMLVYQKIKLTSYSTYSLFINEPMKKISEIIKKYNFIPLPINILDHYKNPNVNGIPNA